MLKPNQNKKIITTFLIFAFLITSGAKCGWMPEGAIKEGRPDPVKVIYWSVSYFDDKSMKQLIAEYVKRNPHVSIEYRRYDPSEFYNKLLIALANDSEPDPDIISAHTTSMRKYLDFISPMPDKITTYYAFETGTFKKVEYTGAKTKSLLSINDLRNKFPDIVALNQVINNKIYGLPLGMDTLALYYNRELLNNAGIQTPASDWETFQQHVTRMTKVDSKGVIIQSGAAMGTSNNISRSPDILSLLFMQSGHPIIASNNRVYINNNPESAGRKELITANALNFYNSFASPSSENFSWDEQMPDAQEAFRAGTVAYYLGYAYEFLTIKNHTSISVDIAPVPQLSEQPINFGNYWVECVTAKSKNKDVAWDFITYAATDLEANKKYLIQSKRPAALRDLLNVFEDDLYLGAFGTQALTAKSWYRGTDPDTADRSLKNLIANNLKGTKETDLLLGDATAQINSAIGK